MPEQALVQILLLLGTAVVIVVAFQRLNIPSSLGYLLVGLLLGPHTAGPVIASAPLQALAEFGIVFLLFTIGLNYSLPQIHALRNMVLGLGTAQVALTTLVVGVLAWLAGLPAGAAFVTGAVFAQSSTTIISNQLQAQGEDNSRHGRLGVAMSVFQDVTAVPLLILIPAFGLSVGALSLAVDLGQAFASALLAFALVFVAGRWLLRPVFHFVAAQRSPELFTLTVLFVSLLAGWTVSILGLSMAFGAFLAGMMLGETEFRHQVEATIRPFRDVLLGLFFIGIGMLIDPAALAGIWHLALLGAVVLMGIKTVLVAAIVRGSGIDPLTAWRTGLLLAVGGEFGFALLAIALGDHAITPETGQIVLYAVLFSMIVAPLLIRYNHAISALLAPAVPVPTPDTTPQAGSDSNGPWRDHVIICGYGRMGQSIGNFLEEEKIPYIALDLDATRVREAHLAGEPAYYGDSSQGDVLDAVGLARARLVVISHNDVASALRALAYIHTARPGLPVMVRTHDEAHIEELRAAGATEVIPETLEASLMVASSALLLLQVPLSRVVRRIREQRRGHYRLLRESFTGDELSANHDPTATAHGLRTVVLPTGSPWHGRILADIPLPGVAVTAIVRQGERHLAPTADLVVAGEDVFVLSGPPDHMERAARTLQQ